MHSSVNSNSISYNTEWWRHFQSKKCTFPSYLLWSQEQWSWYLGFCPAFVWPGPLALRW